MKGLRRETLWKGAEITWSVHKTLRGDLHVICSTLTQGRQGQVPISSLCWPVTGLKRMTWSRVEEGLGWISGGGSSPKGCLGTSTCSPGNWLQCQAWQHLRSISKMFSGMWCGFGVVLCRARTWAWWSLWVPSNSVYVILLMYTVSVTHVFSWTLTGFGRDLHCEQIWRNRLAKIIFLSP